MKIAKVGDRVTLIKNDSLWAQHYRENSNSEYKVILPKYKKIYTVREVLDSESKDPGYKFEEIINLKQEFKRLSEPCYIAADFRIIDDLIFRINKNIKKLESKL